MSFIFPSVRSFHGRAALLIDRRKNENGLFGIYINNSQNSSMKLETHRRRGGGIDGMERKKLANEIISIKKCDNELCNIITNNVHSHYYDFYSEKYFHILSRIWNDDKMPTANFSLLHFALWQSLAFFSCLHSEKKEEE